MSTRQVVIWVWFAIALLVSPFLSHAQEKAPQLKIDTAAISVPPGWHLGNQTRDSIEIYVPLQKERRLPDGETDRNQKPKFIISSEASMLITIERRKDHAEAVRRLAEIASEYPEPATMLIVSGWPAIERRYRDLMPQPGGEFSSGNIETTFETTAVAIGTNVIRFNTMLAPDADIKLLEQAKGIARGIRAPEGPVDISKRELDAVQKMTKAPRRNPSALPAPGTKPESGREKESGTAVQVQTGWGELEIASNDGQHVVIAANSGYSYSDNFGAAYTHAGGTPCDQAWCDGDPSLAVGYSGAFYYSWIGGPNGTSLGDGVSQSIDNGHTFQFRGMAATCPGTTNCSLADQEHIAADWNNAASGGGDRVYNVWRDFAPTFSIRISCSTDGGLSWTAGTAIGSGDFPRVTVGGDGSVYVAWASGGNMMLHKFSNCDAGLTPQTGWPIKVASFTNVVCPVPGLDRCNGRNILSSPKVVVDDLDPTHIYYVFATSTGVGNEDVMMYDSIDGGATFPRSVRVNEAVTARRFMPWVCVTDGIAYVSWYDRRASTSANNDLTDFYFGDGFVNGGVLQAGGEINLTGNADPQCASGWPCPTNAKTDSESCSAQPQLAGRCSASNAPCDFSDGCPTGQTCNIGMGCPKYGDYNGNACTAGRIYTAWASATAPTGLAAPAGITIYSSTLTGPLFVDICKLHPKKCHPISIDPLWWLKCPQCRANIFVRLEEDIKNVIMLDNTRDKVGMLTRLKKSVTIKGITYNYGLTFKPEKGKSYMLKTEIAKGKSPTREFTPAYLITPVENATLGK